MTDVGNTNEIQGRRHQRYDVCLPAKLDLPDASFSVMVENISGGGAKFAVQSMMMDIIPSSGFALSLTEYGALRCRLRWRNATYCGVSFEISSERKRQIAVDLEKRFAMLK